MFWIIVNGLGFVGTPAGLIWAWIGWVKRRGDQARGRVTMSLAAISAATLSLIVLFVARFLAMPYSRALDRFGLSIAALAVLASLAGQLRLVIPVCLASVGAVMLWYGMTLP
jgi:hypothetical protein